MTARDVLWDLRAGRMPGAGDVAAFARGLADGRVSDAQAGAFAMAVCMGPGLGAAGRVALTEAMRDGGERLAWDLGRPVVDKHSTGGVGDPVSLILAPALAACGVAVPMISGRGLGHTGGTLDKLEAIPGLSVEVDPAGLRALVAEVGCAIVAATGDLAPADRRLYAIRDATSSVDQVDLIVASILSKKLAAGIGALVLDVKCGAGAFMRDRAAAAELAAALVETSVGAGCRSAALVTAMDGPLAPACGNALEVRAAVDVLTGAASGPLHEVTVALGEVLMEMAGVDGDVAGVIADGRAAEVFGRMVSAQGGPADFVDRAGVYLAEAPVVVEVPAEAGGTVAGIDGASLGRAVVDLGGGRRREGDGIDPAVGLSRVVRIGDPVAEGDPLALVHGADVASAEAAARRISAAVTFGEAVASGPVLERIG